MRVNSLFFLAISCLVTAVTVCRAELASVRREIAPQVIEVLRDYTKQALTEPAPAISMWNWPEELKARAAMLSQQQVIEHQGKRVLKLAVTEQLPWERVSHYRAMIIGPDLLPPTADAVALQVRVLEGSFTLSVGSPTIYFGHSDVITAPQTLTAEAGSPSRRVVFSLHDNLIRNFRRAGWARNAPLIYYTRWIQEPMGLNVHRGSAGTLLIERVELLSEGRGKAAVTVEDVPVQSLAPIVDFEKEPAAVERVFRATFEPVPFDGPPKLPRPVWKPPVVSVREPVGGAAANPRHLHVEHLGTEEVVFTGLKITSQDQADAVLLELCVSSPLPMRDLAVDWLLYVAPADQPMNWTRLEPPAAWKSDKANAYDYYLTPAAMRDQPHAFFHLRRTLVNGSWTRLILPLSDFVCVFGNGSMQAAMTEQALPRSEQAFALGWLPSFRQRAQATVFQIRRLAWVRLAGDSSQGQGQGRGRGRVHSFPQVDPRGVRLVPWGGAGVGDFRQMLTGSEPEIRVGN